MDDRAPRQKAELKEQRLVSVLLENILIKTFVKYTNVDFFGSCASFMRCKTNTTFQKKNIIPTVKHSGGSVIVWGCLAGSGRCAVINEILSFDVY